MPFPPQSARQLRPTRFLPIKGSIPARRDIDPSKFDSISQAGINDFKTSRLLEDFSLVLAQAFGDALDPALGQFVQDGNAQNVILAVQNHYDLLIKK